MAGTLEEGSLRTGIGSLPLPAQIRQNLERANAGREVIVGIRPENFEDASLVQPDARALGVTFRATIDVIESLGSDVFAYFTQASGLTAATDQLADLAADAGQDEVGSGETVTARLDAATRIREGENAELWADVRKMHVFDPNTGQNLSLSTEPAAAGPAAT
jgi:multiple sugar transport system ATP-binding protein